MKKQPSSILQEIIASIDGQGNYPAIKALQKNPDLAAVISKLNEPNNSSDFDIRNKASHLNLNQSNIQSISEKAKSDINDSEDIMQLFPDIELAIQITVSSVISPKDMVSSNLIYKFKSLKIPNHISSKILSIVSDNFNNYYKLPEKLSDMLTDMMFRTGSYIEAVIPESMLDEIINNNLSISKESLSEVYNEKSEVVSLGILGDSVKEKKPFTLESIITNEKANGVDPYLKFNIGDNKSKNDLDLERKLKGLVSVSDNYNILKMPKVMDVKNKVNLRNIINDQQGDSSGLFSTENLNNDIYKEIYEKKQRKTNQFLVLPNTDNLRRKSIGRPLVIKLPSESVIPVYIPGNETEHVGGFVLIDVDGNPVTFTSGQDSLHHGLTSMIGKTQSNNGSLSSMLIKRAKSNLGKDNESPTITQITKVYTSIIENDLLNRLSNGVYKNKLKLGNNDNIYRVMLSRALSDQYTRIIYIPSELLTYYALKYNKNGIGKSYLDNIKTLSSMRAIILFSKIMALTKSSIPLTNIKVTLDPDDPDPDKTMEMSVDQVAKTRQEYLPIGTLSPVNLLEWIHRSGMYFSFEGHPGVPETKFEFETIKMQHEVPDTELEEELRKNTFMAFGLTPEMMDATLSPEFATSVTTNNLLYSQRINVIQKKLSICLTESIIKTIHNDPEIKREIKKVLIKNKGILKKFFTDPDGKGDSKEENKEDSIDRYANILLDEVISELDISLPSPDNTTLDSLSDSYDSYKEALENALDAWINSEFIETELTGDISNYIDTIKEVIKNHYLRNWMSENGYMTELSEITSINEKGDPSLDIDNITKEHITKILTSCDRFIKSMEGVKSNFNKEDEEENDEGDGGEENYEGDGGEENDEGDGGEGNDEGDDIFGGEGDDIFGDEPEGKDTPVEEDKEDKLEDKEDKLDEKEEKIEDKEDKLDEKEDKEEKKEEAEEKKEEAEDKKEKEAEEKKEKEEKEKEEKEKEEKK